MQFSWEFLYGVLGVILVDILLAGDNALLIGLAVQKLPKHLRIKASAFGALGAIILRLLFLFFTVRLLAFPYLRAAGGLFIIFIAFKLLKPEKRNVDLRPAEKMWGAIKIIISADVVMSLDNVLGVAGVARNNFPLLLFGIALSIPLIVFGSSFVAWSIDRTPVLILLGGLFLGWIGGSMITEDISLNNYFLSPFAKYGLPAASCAATLAWWLWEYKKQKRS